MITYLFNIANPVKMMPCYLAALVAYHIHRIVIEPTELEYFFGLAYFGNLLWMVYAFYQSGIGLSVMCMILGIGLYGFFTVLRPAKNYTMHVIWRVAMVLLTIGGVLGFGFEMDNIATVVVYALVAALFLGWGFYRKDAMTSHIGMIFYGIGILFSAVAGNLIYGDLEIIQDWVYLVLWVALSLGIYLWMKRQKDCYRTGYKIATHIGLTIVLIYGMVQIDQLDWMWTLLLQWMVAAGYNVLVMKTAFARHWVTGEHEKPFEIVTQILNGIWILEGLVLLSLSDQTVITQMITIIVMVALCSLNTLKQLQYTSNSKEMGYVPDLYVCGKYVALLAYILFQLHAADYVADIIILLFAIGCIILGFVILKKFMRVFGLALSLLAMIKLILIDIHYDHSAGRAASFLLCGVLCFGISAIYTYVDKRLKRQESETMETVDQLYVLGHAIQLICDDIREYGDRHRKCRQHRKDIRTLCGKRGKRSGFRELVTAGLTGLLGTEAAGTAARADPDGNGDLSGAGRCVDAFFGICRNIYRSSSSRDIRSTI